MLHRVFSLILIKAPRFVNYALFVYFIHIYIIFYFYFCLGGMFANILLGVDVCKFLAKTHPKTGKHPVCTKNTRICIKHI